MILDGKSPEVHTYACLLGDATALDDPGSLVCCIHLWHLLLVSRGIQHTILGSCFWPILQTNLTFRPSPAGLGRRVVWAVHGVWSPGCSSRLEPW